jgi:hypothetical protein
MYCYFLGFRIAKVPLANQDHPFSFSGLLAWEFTYMYCYFLGFRIAKVPLAIQDHLFSFSGLLA